MDIKIIVATHKKYWIPQDNMYIAVHVGAYGKVDEKGKTLDLGYIKDDTGDNISYKNKNYCELTGMYWAWKNLEADYIGLAHYRRHFSYPFARGNKRERVIDREKLEKYLNKSDIILPKPRNYYIETNYSQYTHAHHAEDLDYTRDIIKEKYPQYLIAFDKSMKSTKGHRFNMFIMKKDKFQEYCKWMFDILFELEKRLDITEYSEYDARVFGFVSERLLDVWINTNGYDYINMPYVFLEKQNWIKKIYNFIKRKIDNGKEVV